MTTATEAPPGRESSPGAPPADPAAKRPEGKKALTTLLRPVRGRLAVGRLLGALSGVAAIAPYVILVRLGEELAGGGDPGRVRNLCLALLGALGLQAGLSFVGFLVTHFADLKLVGLLHARLEARLARAPLAWFGQTTSGRVRKALQDDTVALHQLVAHAPVETAAAAKTPLALVAYALVIDWRLGLLTVAIVPVFFALQAFTMRGMGEKTAEMDSRLAEVSSRAVEFVDGIEVVKAFGQVGRAHGRYADAARRFSEFYRSWCEPLVTVASVSQGLVSAPLLILIVGGGGAAMAAAGWVSPADVVATTLIALVVPSTINTLSTSAWHTQIAGNSALRLTETLDAPIVAEPEGESPEPRSHEVAYRDVSFSYDSGSGIAGLDMVLPENSVTALVGPSGSGKSTAATMLARFQDPDHGAVTIGGVDVRELPSAKLYSLVSFVLQDPQLVRGTLRDNIALARPEATDEEILRAARVARLDPVVERLGLNGEIGSGGGVSGGEAQRVSIARAVLADTPIVILDEATSAADPDTESEIQAGLSALARGRTVLVIAHRPETLRGVDQVVALDEGRVARVLRGSEITDAALNDLMGVTQ